MVKLPAETCPACKTNLRTGEKPEEEVSIWQRRGFKTLVVSACILAPLLTWAALTGKFSGEFIERMRTGLQSCAEPPKKMWDTSDPAEDKRVVRAGYGPWRERQKTRPVGQDPNGPETEEWKNLSQNEKILRTDRRDYFAASIFSLSASPDLKTENNWYSLIVGEWDVAWIPGGDFNSPDVQNGEWNFTWINAGEAIQDVLSIPYLWEKRNKDSVRTTTIRTFNPNTGIWEGAHIQNGRILPFQATRNRDGNIFESYQTGPGVIVVWTFANIDTESFQVYINQTNNGGQSYQLLAEIWAKKRLREELP
jgi:hypothetical protein